MQASPSVVAIRFAKKMKVFIALVLIIASVSAYLDDPDGTTYFIKNANNNKFLYVDEPYLLPSGLLVARNVYTYDVAHELPSSPPSAMFQLVTNNVLGPYYNIINPATNSTLFASEISVGTEHFDTVNRVLAWTDRDHKNTPEAMWNIRHFDDSLYIFNVHYGSYLYTNDNSKSAALLGNKRRVAMLIPNDVDGGRIEGTQWLLLNTDEPGETIITEDIESKLRREKMVTKDVGKEGKVISESVEKGGEGVKEDEQTMVGGEMSEDGSGELADSEVITVRMDKSDQENRELRENATAVVEGANENEHGVVGVEEEGVTSRENVLGRQADTDKECNGEKEIGG